MPRSYKRRRKAKPLNYKQVKAIGKIARKEIHKEAELKQVDSQPAALANIGGFDSTDVQTIDFNTLMPSQGLTHDDRIGNEIYLKSFQLRSEVDCGSNTVTSMRVLVVQDLESDLDGALELGDVLEYPYGNAGITSFYKSDSNRKFKVLSDKKYFWDSNTASAPQPYDINLKNFGKRKIHLDNTGETGNIGRVHLWAVGNGASSTADMRAIAYRMRYFDN